MLSRKEAYKLSEIRRNKNQAEFLEEDFNASLFAAVQKRNITIVEDLIDYEMQDIKSIDLKNLKEAISQADPEILKRILPHCGFSKPSDVYIPRELVITPGFNYEVCVELLLNWNFTVNPDSKNDEEFVYAAVEMGYLPIIVQLLNFGVNVNMVNSASGLNLLTIACLQQHHEIVEILLKHNADVNVIISDKYWRLIKRQLDFYYNSFALGHNEVELCDVTCLHIAVLNSDPTTTEFLLKYGAKITNDPKFFDITYLALKNEQIDIFYIFSDYGVNVTDIGPKGKTFLHSCVQSNCDRRNYVYYFAKKPEQDTRYDIAKWLLINGANIRLQSPNNSLVYEAITNGHRRTAQLFLDYDPDVQYISTDGNTALHEAIKNDFDLKFIKTLLKLNSPVNIANDNGLTPLILACQRKSQDRWEIIKALLHNNANVNCADKYYLRTPLHFACDDCNLEFVTLLLEKGANPDAINADGKTPLHCACKNGSDNALSIIKLLVVEHNVNIEAMDGKGWTPLFMACRRNNDATVNFLLDNNAYVNHKDLENSTPLHIAVKNETFDVTYSLIKYGNADIDALDNNKQTPLQIAEKGFLDAWNELDQIRSRPNYQIYYDEDNTDIEILETQTEIFRNIRKILVRHAIQLKIAGIKINQKIVLKDINGAEMVVFEDNYTFIREEYKTIYENEIKQLKIENIGTTNITFYDLLTKNIYFLSRFVKNEVFLEALKNDLYKTKFPMYINTIRGRFRDAIIQCKLIDSAREYFRENICENLLDECIDLILSYLSIDELFIFTGAKIPLNG